MQIKTRPIEDHSVIEVFTLHMRPANYAQLPDWFALSTNDVLNGEVYAEFEHTNYWEQASLSSHLYELDEHRSRLRVLDHLVSWCINPFKENKSKQKARMLLLYPNVRSIVMYDRKGMFGLVLDAKVASIGHLFAVKCFGYPRYQSLYEDAVCPRYLRT